MGADSPRAPLHAEVWIDVERGYPAALLLQSEALDWFQIFTGCNEALQIDVPQVSAGPNV